MTVMVVIESLKTRPLVSDMTENDSTDHDSYLLLSNLKLTLKGFRLSEVHPLLILKSNKSATKTFFQFQILIGPTNYTRLISENYSL